MPGQAAVHHLPQERDAYIDLRYQKNRNSSSILQISVYRGMQDFYHQQYGSSASAKKSFMSPSLLCSGRWPEDPWTAIKYLKDQLNHQIGAIYHISM